LTKKIYEEKHREGDSKGKHQWSKKSLQKKWVA
jgi:dipeptidyl-peptidase-4